MYKMRGRIEVIGRPVTIGSAKKLMKQSLTLKVVKRDIYDGSVIMENYPTFEFLGDKTKLLEQLRPGMVVEIGFEVLGREVTRTDGSKVHVNNLRGLVIAELRRQQPEMPAHPASAPSTPPAKETGRETAARDASYYAQDDYNEW